MQKVLNLLESSTIKVIIVVLWLIWTILWIYWFLLWDKKINLQNEITSETNVVSLNAEVWNIEVRYNNKNLKETNEDLRIYTIKVINNWNKDITKDLYDENSAIWLRVSNWEIIELPEITQTSNTYLKENLQIIKEGKNIIKFQPIILEKWEFFTIKLLVLYNRNNNINLNAIWKIAGQKDIEVLNKISQEKVWVIEKAYYGSFSIQIMRLIWYFLIWAGIFIIAVRIIIYAEDQIEKNKRKKIINSFKKTHKYTKIDDAIFYRYQNNWLKYIQSISTHLKNDTMLKYFYEKIHEKEDRQNSSRTIWWQSFDWLVIKNMIEDGIIIENNNKISINYVMKKTINNFINYVIKEK